MFFDALDLLEGMGWGDYQRTLDPQRAQKVLSRLEREVPGSVDKIMLDRCRRALSSLAEIQDGFFVRERIKDRQIDLVNDKGQTQPYGLGKAAASYLRLVRNSSHSFINDSKKPFHLSLLASHTGDIPSSVSDLPLLYFMELLMHPEEKLRSR